MKKAIIFSLLFALCPSVYAESANPFVYETGNLSLGVVSGDTLALYDIFQHAEGITARVGGSLTLAQYDRFGFFIGAAAPTSDASSIAIIGGPSLDLDDVAKSMIKSILEVVPFKIDNTTIDNLSRAARLKIYVGRDFRNDSAISGVGFGVGLF